MGSESFHVLLSGSVSVSLVESRLSLLQDFPPLLLGVSDCSLNLSSLVLVQALVAAQTLTLLLQVLDL